MGWISPYNSGMTPANTTWWADAPGSLMLMGEHAVLHGKRALVCAVDQRLRVTLTPRPDRTVRVHSALGEEEASLGDLAVRKPFRFVWACVRAQAPAFPSGCDLKITSDFPADIGFGSSAAVTVAVCAVLNAWLGIPHDRAALHQAAWKVIRSVQGRGSGADAAASVFGGMVEYRADPLKLQPLNTRHPITVVYSGYKTPTTEVIARVEAERQNRQALFNGFFFEIDECVSAAVDAVCRDHWAELGVLMDRNHALMKAIGVSDDTLEEIADTLRKQPGILGAKISGSGLGDCVVGLGTVDKWPLPFRRIPCAMTTEGVRVEQG